MFYPPLRPYINNTVEEENMLRKNRGDLIYKRSKKGAKNIRKHDFVYFSGAFWGV